MAVPSLQQGVDGSMPGPGAVGEPVAGRPGRAGRLIVCWIGGRFWLGGGDEDSQAAAVLGDGPFGGLDRKSVV